MKIDAARVTRLLRHRSDDPNVVALVSELGLTVRLNPERRSVAFAAPSHGISLRFDQASKLVVPMQAEPGTFVVASAFFYSRGHQGHVGFEGELPQGLRFEQSRSQVRAALGKPAMSAARLENDCWKLADYWLTVDFSENESSILLVTAALPWRQ